MLLETVLSFVDPSLTLSRLSTVAKGIFIGKSIKNASEKTKAHSKKTASNNEDSLMEIDIENKNTKNTEKKKGLFSKVADLWNKGIDKTGDITYITGRTFSGTKNVGDFLNKQNYIASSVIADGFSFEKLEDSCDSWDTLRDNKESGYKYIKSNLTSKEQKEAREYAVELLKERLKENIASYPDYGDVRKYYNEGSLMDWLISHPVSFGANALSEACDKNGKVTKESIRGKDSTKSDNWYKTVSQDIMGQDGMFTIFNTPTYIAHSNDGEVRKDSGWDMLGNIKSTENIDKELKEYANYIVQLEENIDNPEEFSKIFYNATEGMNFNPDNTLKYKKNSENKKENEPIDTIIGRNYISEDIGKNEMAINIAYETNKTVGTKLCAGIPVVGPFVAGGVNIGVTVTEEKTQKNSEITNGEWFKIIAKEGFLRYFAVNSASSFLKDKTGGSKGMLLDSAIANGTKESANIATNLTKDVIDGNNITGDIVESQTLPKTGIKTLFNFAFSWLKR